MEYNLVTSLFCFIVTIDNFEIFVMQIEEADSIIPFVKYILLHFLGLLN